MKAVLYLEDGKSFSGESFGSEGTTIAEVVFNTGMTGYQEIMTDPSYKGQMVTMTYPHIGNYGINHEDVESATPHVDGFIIRDLCKRPSNYRSEMSLHEYLKKNNIPGIHQVDTRELTRHIRSEGSKMAVLTTEDLSRQEMKSKLDAHPGIVGQDLVQHVTIPGKMEWTEGIKARWHYSKVGPLGTKQFHVVAFDFGIKRNILRLMTSFGLKLTVVPASTTAEEVKALNPDGIFLSNGPGDPQGVRYAVETIKKLIGYKPMFGICLGHQLIGLAFGAKVYKLKFGHHGCNHPVKNLKTGNIEITSQNHNFAIDPADLEPLGFTQSHRNLNDHTLEGMVHKTEPVFSVQYHPEASPGPHDSVYLFKRFYQMMDQFNK